MSDSSPYGMDRVQRFAKRTTRHHATSEHVFDADENEFLKAIQAFKSKSGKSFPTYTEILGVVKALGYMKVGDISQIEPGDTLFLLEEPAPPGDERDLY